MANFYKYTEPLEVLNTEDMANFQANFNFLKITLKKQGINALFRSLANVKKDTPLLDVRKILNDVEYNLDILNSKVPSDYYVKKKQYEHTAPNKDDVWRWVQILNDAHSQLVGESSSVVFVTAGQQGATDEELEDLLFDTE